MFIAKCNRTVLQKKLPTFATLNSPEMQRSLQAPNNTITLKTISQLFQEDKQALLNLPHMDYEVCRYVTVHTKQAYLLHRYQVCHGQCTGEANRPEVPRPGLAGQDMGSRVHGLSLPSPNF